MNSFHNDPELKAKYTKRVLDHFVQDQIIHGTYWDAWEQKGCAVGCTMETSSAVHFEMSRTLGLPMWLCHLEESLFESNREGTEFAFPYEFIRAVPVGLDLDDREFKTILANKLLDATTWDDLSPALRQTRIDNFLEQSEGLGSSWSYTELLQSSRAHDQSQALIDALNEYSEMHGYKNPDSAVDLVQLAAEAREKVLVRL